MPVLTPNRRALMSRTKRCWYCQRRDRRKHKCISVRYFDHGPLITTRAIFCNWKCWRTATRQINRKVDC